MQFCKKSIDQRRGAKRFSLVTFCFEMLIFVSLAGVIGGLIFFNSWLNTSFASIQKDSEIESSNHAYMSHLNKSETFQNSVLSEDENIKEKVIRKFWKDPSKDFFHHHFYLNDEIIAKYKSKLDQVYDIEGSIPDGRVEFVNLDNKTFGYEHYRENQRHGDYVEYYEVGRVSKIKTYFFGELTEEKEYFWDRILRMKVDLTDALYVDSNDVSPGVGKMYHRNGKVKFVWNFTKSDANRYDKIYDQDGSLIAQRFYKKNGELKKKVNYESLKNGVL